MENFFLNGSFFSSTTENKLKNENLTIVKTGEITEYLLSLEFNENAPPKVYSLSWAEDLVDAYGFWSPSCGQSSTITPDWSPRTQNSRSASGLPLVCIYDKKNYNKTSVYISDVANACSIQVGVIEESVKLKYTLNLFTGAMPKMTSYSVVIRTDKRSLPFYEIVKNAKTWWTELGYIPATVPTSAKKPLYSFWYSYHQNVDSNSIIEECTIAKEFGFETIIVDDGWQTDDGNRGYAYCGDWEVAQSKIPDMKSLVNEVHALGLKFMLWFSVPFVGYRSKNYKKFLGKYLSHQDDRETSILDPRFSEVRSYLTKTYEIAVKEYGYDGLKLDFIDEFTPNENLDYDYAKMDCLSVEEGLYKLLSETTQKLKKINPDILIEFRQSYIGPIVGSFGNLFRVVDCPADAITNKISGLNLRLTSSETAVHSDMITWNMNESNEGVLNQLLSSLFIVPQISVRLAEISLDHKKILKNFLTFWREHSDTLLNGELKVFNVTAGYTMASSEKDGEKITVVYDNQVLTLGNFQTEFIFNSTGENRLYLQSNNNSTYFVYDYFGNLIETGAIESGLQSIFVPHAHLLKIK